MFGSYLKIILRNLIRHRIFSFINVIGLAVGITCFVVLTLFVIAGLIALLIALATVSYQSIKAALANPVEALRYE
ncbi:MAG: hypothetical protein HYS25_06035 [Ignavibacteriales bacterium]|nr:hypothetical protein [Ignavibacteriales bacterium]